MKNYIITLVLFIFSSIYTNAQISGNYPVSINPVIYPPYPNSIKNLATGNSPSLVLTIVNKSAISNFVNFNIAVTIKSNNFIAQTKQNIIGLSPILLTGSNPLRLTNLDISPAFEFNNLTGISINQYEQQFPQSKVTFEFVLYDAITGKQISDKVPYSVVYSVSNPPTTFLPKNNSVIIEKGFQNVLFQWQPRQTAATNAVKYIFELIELLSEEQDPNSAFLTTKPIFIDSTFDTKLNYNANYPPLMPGKKYVWRIKAKTFDNGGFELGFFLNNGYSNISTFKYRVDCKSPTMLSVSEINKSDAYVTWASMPEYENFLFSYRKKGEIGWKDYKLKGLLDPQYALSGLNESTAYEVKVTTVCDDGSNAESNIKEFITTNSTAPTTTQASIRRINASCGNIPTVKAKNKNLLQALNADENITSGDFTIQVTDANGQNGIFSGKGIIELWLSKIVKLNVLFDKITVNIDHEVIDGKITIDKN